MGVDLTRVAPVARPGRGPDPTGRRRPDPGRVLAVASVAPALVLAAWLLAAYPLALAGRATPLLAVPAALVVAGLLLAPVLHRLPAVPDTPWWSVAATGAIAVGFAAFTAAHAAGHVVLRRDSAVYALLARWIADTGGLRIPARLEFIGAPDAVVTTTAPALYPVGDSLTAQFMSGTALTLAPAGWGAGWGAILLVPALLGAVAVVAFAGLAGRLAGPRWAPVAAAGLALLQPMLLTFRSTYSEPLAQLLLVAALCLLLDAAAGASRPLGAPAGLLVGLGLLVRVDAVRDIALLVPVVAWLAVRRNPCWWPVALGAAVGTGYGVVDAYGPAHAYVSDLIAPVRTAAYGGLLLVGLAVVAVPVVRRRGLPRVPAWAATGTAAAVGAGLVTLSLRPLFYVGHGTGSSSRFIESMQREQGLPVDAQHSYAELTVRWVSWYAGWPALGLAAAAAVLLTRRALLGRDDAVTGQPAHRWLLGLGLPLVSAVSVLLSPGITPDHPWADRRLVPTVLPLVTLLAVWSLAAAVRAVGRWPSGAGRWPSGAGRRWSSVVLVAGLVALLLPPVLGSRALPFTRTEQGEPAAVEAACASFAPGEVALLVDARSRQEWTAVLREVCDVPAFGVPGDGSDDVATRAQVTGVAARVRAAGGRPVLIAQSGRPLPGLTGDPQRQVVDLDTQEYARLIMSPPRHLVPLSIELWRAEPD